MNRLLIVGFGDIARRALPALVTHFSITAVVRHALREDAAPRAGIDIRLADLDEPPTLTGIGADCTHVAHLAPPPVGGTTDPRTAHLLAAFAGIARKPGRIVYVSTSGVYGDCAGAEVDERRALNPQSDRARRRVDAEQQIARFGAAHGIRTVVLRAPGIYAAERLPIERVMKGTPVLRREDDVYTNHIHADDLAAMLVAALTHPRAAGVYNASDDSALYMGDWFDLIADRAGLPRPPRITRDAARSRIPAPLFSFMSESRRLVNTRVKTELDFALRYPTVFDGVPAKINPPAR